MITTLFEGQANIVTIFRSFGTDADARRIRKAVVGSTPLLADEDNEVSVLALLLSNTLSIEFSSEAALTEEVKAMKKYWDWINEKFILRRDDEGYISELSADPTVCADVWRKYRRMIGNQAQNEWYMAFQKAQNIHPPSPELAKEEDIPDTLKSDPDFLAGEKKPEDGSETAATITSLQLGG